MKPKNNDAHDHSEQEGLRHWPRKIKQYLTNYYNSKKYKKMSCGSCYIAKCISWAHGDNWRRNHPKSLNKHHK